MKTKQEQIKEMKTLLSETYIEWLDKPAVDKKSNLHDMESKALYNAGYRKADVVRNETAREILDKLNALMEQYYYKSTAWRNCANFIKELTALYAGKGFKNGNYKN